MEWEFAGELWYWRGPAPWHFVTVPADVCTELQDESSAVSYGWGMIPVAVRLGSSRWDTSLWPKDGRYIVPIKAPVRAAEQLDDGELVTLRISLRR